MRGILDYRNAKHAIELMGQGTKGFEQLSKHPELGDLMLQLLRAQDVEIESPGEAVAAVADQLSMSTDEEED